MYRAVKLTTSLFSFLFVASVCGLLAANYSDVLLVANSNSSDSLYIADYFAQARNVTHRLNVSLPNNTYTMKFGALNESLFTPVRNYLNSTNDTINYIVLSMDFPTRTNETEDYAHILQSNYSSVDSELMLVNGPYEQYMGGVGPILNPYSYYSVSPNGFPQFSHGAYGIYLVTRLDGNNTADAQGLVDRATHIRRADRNSGKALLAAVNGIPAGYYTLTNTTLSSAGFNVTVNATPGVVATIPNTNYQNVSFLDFYAYPSFSPSGLPTMTWKNGSFAIERYSFGGVYTDYSFEGYDSWAVLGIKLVAQGATAVVAYPTEPTGTGSMFNYLFARNFLTPRPYADMIWNSVYLASWSTIVFADPKASYPAIAINITNNQSSGYIDCNLTFISNMIPSANLTYQWYKNDIPYGSQGSVQNLAAGASFTASLPASDFSGYIAKCQASAYLGDELLDSANASLTSVLSTPNQTFNLTSNVTVTGTTAFNVNASNVTIDCNGFSITGDNTAGTFGIYSNQPKTTIKNCIISNFPSAIYFNGATNGTIQNSTANATSGWGIALLSSPNNQISNSTGSSASNIAIYLSSSSNNILIGTTGAAISSSGIQMDSGSNYNQISNSTGTSTSNYGINIISSSYNNITNSIGTSNSSIGIRLSSSSNNITNSTATSISNYGISFESSSNNNIRLSSFSSNSISALRLDSGSASNLFLQNSITGPVWINNSGSGNSFNNSSVGNAYYFANGSGAWTAFNITDDNGNRWADSGSSRPFNNTTVSGYWLGNGADYYPYTLVAGPPGINSLQVSPSSPSIFDSLQCLLNIHNSIPANVSIEWYKNGANQSGLAWSYSDLPSAVLTSISTVPSASLSASDSWYCLVNVQYNATDSSGWIASSPVTIAICGALSNPGQNILTSNASVNGSTCFNVTAANVTIDCNGHSITGNNATSAYGIYSNQYNTTVRNCIISNFQHGIYFNGSSNGTITNNTLSTTHSSGYPVYLSGSTSYAAVIGNTIRGSRWISNSGASVSFNNSTSGNAYYFANGSGAWTAFNITDGNGDGWADGGADRPFNSSTVSSYWSGNGADYHPAMPTPLEVAIDSPTVNSTVTSVPISISITVSSPRIDHTTISLVSQNGSTANSTVAYANGTFQVSLGAPDGIYNITATAYDTLGSSNSTSVSGITVAVPVLVSQTGGSGAGTPILSSSFDCQNSVLTVQAKYSGLPVAGLGIRLRYASEYIYARNFTDPQGIAAFEINRNGNYTLESEQATGFYAFYSEPFALVACEASLEMPVQPLMIMPQNQTQPKEQPSENNSGIVGPLQSSQQPGDNDSRSPGKLPSLPPEVKQAVQQAAIPLGVFLAISSVVVLAAGGIIFYVWRIRAR